MIKKIINIISKPYIKINLKFPLWSIILIIFIPIFAYYDVIFYGVHSFNNYLILCSVEIFLIYLGYLLSGLEYFAKQSSNGDKVNFRGKNVR